MNTSDYIEIIFKDISGEQIDTVVALLSDLGFEGFEEGEQQLKAYINEADFNEETFQEAISTVVSNYEIKKIQSQNWNAVWEEQFEPELVDDFVGIRAHFHPPFSDKVQHEIVITPKMSFGTGHHATTWMMIKQMQYIDFSGKQVLDFGTGTGILAILSEKLGAARVLAIDNDDWSIENAKENIERNNCSAIQLQQADEVITEAKFDVVLANINKNVILQHIHHLNECLQTGGVLLISGLLAEDEADIFSAVSSLQLDHKSTLHRNNWICMLFAR